MGITGHQAELWLQKNYGVQVELSDLTNLLSVLSGADDEQTIGKLLNGLTALCSVFRQKTPRTQQLVNWDPPDLVLTPREAFYAPSEIVSLEHSVGFIAAEWLMTYPPGIPLILPGELVGEAVYHHIQACRTAGLTVLGTAEPGTGKIRIVRR